MEKIRIKNLEEDVYYEKLDNGLEVYLYTKDDIYTNYVTFTTKYGSVYNDFVPIGESKIRSFPKGIAHFLEHKVFTEKKILNQWNSLLNLVLYVMLILLLEILHTYFMLRKI